MKNEINKIVTQDCIIAILSNAPAGYEGIKGIAFRFNDSKFLEQLKLPKLKYLDTIESSRDLSFHLNYDPLREFFNHFIDGIEKSIKVTDNGFEVIDKINKALRDLIKMAEKEMEISLIGCMGLFGELLQLRELLEKNPDQALILSGWNRPAPSNHDFDYEKEAIEIKTLSKDKTTLKITSAFQLEAPKNKQLYLKVYRLEAIDKSSSDSLGILYSEIENMLKTETLKEEFEAKCMNDKIKYGGPRVISLPYKFIVLEEMKYFVDQNDFPRIKRSSLSPAISNVSYEIDLSSISGFTVQV